jgi:hypothetical protein
MNLMKPRQGLASFEPPADTPPPLPPPRFAPSPRKVESGVIDVAQELEQAFHAAKRLLEAAEYDDSTPLNQKAQIIGALNTVLTNITKSRTEVFSAERNRALEAILIRTLKKHPTLQKDFMEDYAKELKHGI